MNVHLQNLYIYFFINIENIIKKIKMVIITSYIIFFNRIFHNIFISFY